jgi:hypothetical protein
MGEGKTQLKYNRFFISLLPQLKKFSRKGAEAQSLKNGKIINVLRDFAASRAIPAFFNPSRKNFLADRADMRGECIIYCIDLPGRQADLRKSARSASHPRILLL